MYTIFMEFPATVYVCFVQITVYVGKRDFVDHVTKVDPIGKGHRVAEKQEPKMPKHSICSFSKVCSVFMYI